MEVFRRGLSRQQRAWIGGAASAAAGGALVLAADANLCAAFGSVFTAVPAFFLECTLSMACLHGYLQCGALKPRRATPARAKKAA